MPADRFKRTPEEFRRRAWSLINKFLSGEYTCSSDVLEAKVILLCKDAMSPDLLGNYRPITLYNAFYQLLNSIIRVTSRLRHLTENHAVLEVANLISVLGEDATTHDVRQRHVCPKCNSKGNNTYKVT